MSKLSVLVLTEIGVAENTNKIILEIRDVLQDEILIEEARFDLLVPRACLVIEGTIELVQE